MSTEGSVRLTGELLVDDMTSAERARAERVESVLPALRQEAAEADARAEFPLSHIGLMSDAGLLGLVVPVEYGGLGGGLRDLAAATFAMGTACPSTALAYIFQCSSASRGLLPLEAADAGLFDESEEGEVRAFAERLLNRMGTERKWLANFASESAKSSQAAISIATEAAPTEGGWTINGVKSFGCATGVADDYLVTARLAGGHTAEHLAIFIVDAASSGVSERTKWDAIGMRATATHGIVLEDVFVPADDALAVPGAFVKMLQMSRGSFVGNQLAAAGCYAGAAQAVYDFAVEYLTTTPFADTAEPIGSSPLHQQLIGEMRSHLDAALVWLRRQIDLETSDPPLASKEEVIRTWRLAKGEIAERAFAVAVTAMKACGTSNTGIGGPVARGLRDLSMGLVQGFPPERGRLEAAASIVHGAETPQFVGRDK